MSPLRAFPGLILNRMGSAGVPADQQGYPQGYPTQNTSSTDKAGSAPPYQQQNTYQQGGYNSAQQGGYPQNNYQPYNNNQQGYPQNNYQQQPYYSQPAPAGYPVRSS